MARPVGFAASFTPVPHAIKEIGPSITLKEMTDNMENVADFCDDVSDIIRCIAVSHV
jgi:hypothetical protein